MRSVKGFVLATFLGLVALTALAAPASAAPASAKPAGEVGVLHAACGTTAPDEDDSAWNDTGGGANMRSGSSTTCALKGAVDEDEKLDYHCYTFGNDGFTWTYLRNHTTGETGWVRDNLLADNGSYDYCGF